MLIPDHLCSGVPGSRIENGLPCRNLAQVRLESLSAWKRPMCIDCAERFDAYCADPDVGLPPPLFSVLPEYE